jgi:hypothetical protein
MSEAGSFLFASYYAKRSTAFGVVTRGMAKEKSEQELECLMVVVCLLQ